MISHYIHKNYMIKDYEEGGLKTIDFDIMNGVIKLRWLQSFINDKSSFWFEIPSKNVVAYVFCCNVTLNFLNSL